MTFLSIGLQPAALRVYRAFELPTWFLYNVMLDQRTNLEAAVLVEQWDTYLKVHLRCQLGDDTLQGCCISTTKEGFSINQ